MRWNDFVSMRYTIVEKAGKVLKKEARLMTPWVPPAGLRLKLYDLPFPLLSDGLEGRLAVGLYPFVDQVQLVVIDTVKQWNHCQSWEESGQTLRFRHRELNRIVDHSGGSGFVEEPLSGVRVPATA